MEHYAGLDVSLRLTAICVLDERGFKSYDRAVVAFPIRSPPQLRHNHNAGPW
jgi:hypothetical protein